MAIADASLSELRYALEVSPPTTYGTPISGAAYQAIRMVSETLGQDKEIVQSEEIVSDRRPPDNIQVGSSGSGDIVSEVYGGNTVTGSGGVSSATLDDFWAAAIGVQPTGLFPGSLGTNEFVGDATFTTFTSGSGGGATIVPANDAGGTGNDRITLTATVGTGTWTTFAAGQWVSISGFTGVRTILNNIYQVVARTTTVLTLTKGPRVPTTPGSETPTAANPFTAQRLGEISDGTFLQFFSIERKYAPITNFAGMTGFALKGFDFDMRPKQSMRITWHWVGKEEVDLGGTARSSSVTPAITTRKSFSPVSDFKGISLDEDGHTFSVTSFSLKVDGKLYLQDEEAGTLGPQGVGVGTFDVSGSMEFYYEGGTISGFYQTFTQKALSYGVYNAAGDALMFNMPRVNFSNHRRSTPGKDQAVKGKVDFKAAKGTDALPATTYLIKIARH